MDCICCGFGAVILMFVITTREDSDVNGQVKEDLSSAVEEAEKKKAQELAELEQVTEEVESLKEALAKTKEQVEDAKEAAEKSKAGLEKAIADKSQGSTELNKLMVQREKAKTELETTKKEIEKTGDGSQGSTGKAVSEFSGDGRRHYLTGMKVDGERTLFLVDASASMLANRMSGVAHYQGSGAPVSRKWVRTLDTIDWLMATMESDKYQVAYYNETTWIYERDSKAEWLDAKDVVVAEEVSEELWSVNPEGGANLEAAMQMAMKLEPKPDNVFLITDSLPTHSNKYPTSAYVTADKRRAHLRAATDIIGNKTFAVNIILFPLDGDPAAGGAYWKLAHTTGGSLFTPAPDWPN